MTTVCASGDKFYIRTIKVIVGLGIDLVEVKKISKSIKSDSFRSKVFTPAEVEYCEATQNSAEHFAGKFAAKEAFMKAIGRGIRQEVWFTQIEVLNRDTGEPFIRVSGEAKKMLDELGAVNILLSISHTDRMSTAVVILER
jgi:holo-[acyl-carrier protein] synthase